jgi:hypothetical protein
MNYVKLAVVLVRTWAAVWIGFAVMGLAWYGLAALKGSEAVGPSPEDRLAGSVWYLLFGGLLFLLSRPVARLLSKGT